MSWLRRRFLVPGDLEDAFAGALWAAGSRGHETRATSDGGRAEIDAFFAADSPPFLVPSDWSRRGLEALGEDAFAEMDWQETFRREAVPFRVGKRLIIDPGEGGRRFFLQLPARAAFGTGTHESTRLALELLEGLDLTARSVLDVGTGTGVLAFAALLFGAARAVAFDVDAAAAFAARDNARRNDVRGCLVFAGPIDALAEHARFDVALLNVVPEEACPLLAALGSRLPPGADLIASGILASQAPEWIEQLRAAGFAPAGEASAAEWTALRLRRT